MAMQYSGVNVLLVGHDKASSGALDLLAAKIMGADVCSILAHGSVPVSRDDIESVVVPAAERASIIVTGISSSAELAVEEIVAAEVARRRIVEVTSARHPDTLYPGALQFLGSEPNMPVILGVYLDTDMGDRHWFDRKVADAVSFVFAPSDDEAKEARKRYPNASRIIVTGNPLEQAGAFPTSTKEQVRAEFGLHDDQPLIVMPGGKDLKVNVDFLEGVIAALKVPPMNSRAPLALFGPYPGDQNDPTNYVSVLEQVMYRARLVPAPQHVDTSTDKPHSQCQVYRALLGGRIHDRAIRSSELIPGADLVVQSASTIGKEAGYQRVPVVNFFTESAIARGPDIADWAPVARGVEEAVSDPGKLSATIARLLTPEGSERMRERQQAVYPRPKYKDEAVDKMVAALKEIGNF